MWKFILVTFGAFLLIGAGVQLGQGNDFGYWLGVSVAALFLAGGGR
jgi:hypothetical protein